MSSSGNASSQPDGAWKLQPSPSLRGYTFAHIEPVDESITQQLARLKRSGVRRVLIGLAIMFAPFVYIFVQHALAPRIAEPAQRTPNDAFLLPCLGILAYFGFAILLAISGAARHRLAGELAIVPELHRFHINAEGVAAFRESVSNTSEPARYRMARDIVCFAPSPRHKGRVRKGRWVSRVDTTVLPIPKWSSLDGANMSDAPLLEGAS